MFIKIFFILLKYVSGFTLHINPVMFSFPCFYVTKEIRILLKRNAGNPRVKEFKVFKIYLIKRKKLIF